MKFTHRTTLATAVIATLAMYSTAFAGGRPDLVLAGLDAGRAHQAGEVIVKYRDGSSAAQQEAVRRGLGASKLETVRGGSSTTRKVGTSSNLPFMAASLPSTQSTEASSMRSTTSSATSAAAGSRSTAVPSPCRRSGPSSTSAM